MKTVNNKKETGGAINFRRFFDLKMRYKSRVFLFFGIIFLIGIALAILQTFNIHGKINEFVKI